MKITLLEPIGISSTLLEELSAPIRAQGHTFVSFDTKTTDPAEQQARIGDSDAVIIANTPLPASVIASAPKLQLLDVAFTDDSGKTREFILPTPEKSLSLNSANSERPYALYGMLIQADGYIDNIHLNIPVFSGVTSIQGSDMMLLETAGVDKGPQIFDELQQFTL